MEEASAGQIIKRFVIKLVLWFILIDVIIGGIILFANIASWSNLDEDDYEELGDAIKTFMNCLVAINVVAIVAAPLLATRSAKKKYKITEENKKSVFKGVVIAIVILAIIMAIIHIAIKNVVVGVITEEADIEWSDMKDAIKDTESFLEENDVPIAQEELKEMVDMVKIFYGRLNFYGVDWLLFVVMIGVEYVLIVKKESQVA